MTGSPATGFVIRTASGDKGPFTAEQIARFVEKGKLAATAKIFDVAGQRTVTAAEASGADAPPRDEDKHDTTLAERVDANAETPPAPGLRAPSTARHGRAAERAQTRTIRPGKAPGRAGTQDQ